MPSLTVAAALRLSGLDPADARVLLRATLRAGDAQLAAHPERRLTAPEREAFLALVERRRAGEPVAYLAGEREFYSLAFKVAPAVLIPRPETEGLVDWALERLPPEASPLALDLGTGSGCVAIAIAKHRPRARVTATDISAGALALARENAARHGAGIEFLQSDWFAALGERRFDLIVSNPPYVAEDDPHLAQGDLRFEPRAALAAGARGLDAIETIVEQAVRRLRPGGWLLLEHGEEQGACVRALLAAAGYRGIETRQDLAARERITGARFDGGGGSTLE
jgi:release factor glutamine methyltransferase